VECPTGGPVRLRVFEGTNAWYQAFLVLDHRTPLASLEMLPQGASSWLPLRREPYNVFVRSGGVISAPVRLRATDVYGQTVEGELPSLGPGTEAAAAGQFRGVCGP
jgi:expansin